ncbi:von Willebrand factor type A domain-containing protein [Lasiosphaeria ovina]|uniref:von Willebrand factor type A domain-containing protein n=1 Tax=Lasiosphaeria ovina TaxID=92902 RepID=A0AAE0JZS3_9PEZI|nr:von Willebrand factor type A domain-containing protein [Lasiosphaeria ovina]
MAGRIPSGLFFTDYGLGSTTDIPPKTIFSIFPTARPHFDHRFGNGPTDGSGPGSTIHPPSLPIHANPSTQFQVHWPPPDTEPEQPNQVRCLPLLDVAIDVRVDCAVATSRFIQRFTNISDVAIPEAHYTFPLYDGAVVTSMQFHIGDSDVLTGRVLSNEEAKIEYLRAIEGLESAALLEEMTPEVFQTMIGNIPPKTSVKVDVTYINALKPDSGGQGHLITIPTSLAPRYGTPPRGLFTNSSDVVNTGLSIVVAVNTRHPIRQIECRSHPVSIDVGSSGAPPDLTDFDAFYAQASSEPKKEAFNSHQATIKLSDPTAIMDKDFVVFINNSGDNARSEALVSPANGHGHSALMVTIQPSELFRNCGPDMDFKGEVIFVADRSGSMGGEKIAGLRNALHVFLKSLPEKCTFNLCSFGTSFRSLWESSTPYSQATLDQAVSHVSSFAADMGGTELLPALQNTLLRRATTGHSTQVIVLTDGEVWNVNQTIDFVKSMRTKLGHEFRLFALGIGNSVSHRLIEGIADAGGGFGEVVGLATPDKWQHRVIRMLKGALMPPTWSCQVDLGPQFTRRNLYDNSFALLPDTESDGKQPAPDSLEYVQAPESPLMHHFKQTSVFLLLKTGSAALPSEVTVTATAGGTSREGVVKAALPVLSTATTESHLQHLAVKAALLDLDLRADQEQSTQENFNDSVASRNAVSLGKSYSVTSRWTSFVATNQDGSVAHAVDSYNAALSDNLASPASMVSTPYNLPPTREAHSRSRRSRSSLNYGEFGAQFNFPSVGIGLDVPAKPAEDFHIRWNALEQTPLGPSCWFQPKVASAPLSTAPAPDTAPPSLFTSETILQSVSSLYTTNDGNCYPPYTPSCGNLSSDSATSSSALEINASSAPPRILTYSYDEETVCRGAPVERQGEPQPSIGFNDIVASQTASGRFQITDDVRLELSSNLPAGTREAIIDSKANGQNGQVDEEVVDTIMVSKYIETHMDDQKDLFDLVLMKAHRSVDHTGLDEPSGTKAPGEKDDSDDEEEDVTVDQAGQGGRH